MNECIESKVVDLVDTIFSHNEIVALWAKDESEEGKPAYLIWRGMGHEIPENCAEMKFVRIFGAIPESIIDADVINILVEGVDAHDSVKDWPNWKKRAALCNYEFGKNYED